MGRRDRLSDVLCACGCGEYTSIGSYGTPMQFLLGHNARLQTVLAGRSLPDDPNPSGLCFCGCGGVTPIATRTRSGRNMVKGKHLQYLRRHVETPGYEIDPETDCWVWQGAVGTKGGAKGRPYKINRNGRHDAPYRHFYELHVGPIPAGHHLHHTCETPMCVNPEHLEPLTPAEHNRRHKSAA